LSALRDRDDSDQIDPSLTPVAESERSYPNTPYVVMTLVIAAATFVADQLTKYWALHSLAETRRIEIFGEFLGLRLLRNPGAALGFGYGYTWLLTIVVLAVIVALCRVIRRIRSRAWGLALGLLLGGALGNLVDRLFREPSFGQGHVIDFIAYWNWFVGNVADIAIVVAAAIVVVLSFKGIGVDGVNASDDDLENDDLENQDAIARAARSDGVDDLDVR